MNSWTFDRIVLYILKILLLTSLQFPVDHVGSQSFKKHGLESLGFVPVQRSAVTSLFPGSLIHVTCRVMTPREQVLEHSLHGPGVHLNLEKISARLQRCFKADLHYTTFA
jgi:hypothetical protein